MPTLLLDDSEQQALADSVGKTLSQWTFKAMSATNAPSGGVLVGDGPLSEEEDEDDDDDMEMTEKVGPHTGENRAEFVSRCMSSLAGEFPDEAQRLAVCFRSWSSHKQKMLGKSFPVPFAELDAASAAVAQTVQQVWQTQTADEPTVPAGIYWHPERRELHVTFADGVDQSVYKAWGEGLGEIEAVQAIHGDTDSPPADWGDGWWLLDAEGVTKSQVRLDTEPLNVEFVAPIVKLDDDTDFTFVYGPVLVPEVPDRQGDVISSVEIEKTADDFMEHFASAGVMHELVLRRSAAVPVRSYISDRVLKYGDDEYPAGTWFLGMRLYAPQLRKAALSGQLAAFSIGGIGQRSPA